MDSLYSESGQIAKQNQAEELAYLEKPSRDREAELKRQSETGLTDFERNNIEIMNGLEEKYPLAFDSNIDNKGRKELSTEVYGANDEAWGLGRYLRFTQQGFFAHAGGKFEFDCVDSSKLIDAITNQNYIEPSKNVLRFLPDNVINSEFRQRFDQSCLELYRVDLENEKVIKNMGLLFQKKQEFAEGRKKEEEQKQARLDPQAILARL